MRKPVAESGWPCVGCAEHGLEAENPAHFDDRVKRVTDLLLASTLLIVALPVLLLAGLAIRLETPGPALFIQTRVGMHGRRFRVLKLRTLYRHGRGRSARGGQVRPGDPRVTRVGRVLRRTCLDELPQLVNVLRGEMSLVGPRPHALGHDLHFARLVPGYADRRRVRPGLTGWAQVNGCCGAVEEVAQLYRRTRHDLRYVASRSLALDLAILARTAGVVVRCGPVSPRRD
ncbi:hypothetical protein CKO21_03925 [Rhodovibrio salinarum]|uniref:Bacterial sugar transferase domain-containing protein n=2 Tax=Rhodovibrio salinarum TaxID=1087 RepID=A0A934UZG6_9PROT|nr:hypothetical protein [Rhodovibrio salinarum]